jgi:site-specific recombinase XerD
MAFLEHAEYDRGNSARTRNAWLAAIRAFFRYIEYRVPACLDLALRVRSVPPKRTDTTLIDYLTREEITALLDAPDPRKRLGTRDRAMLHLAYAAGLRVAELLSLQLQDLPERSLATIHIMGKGRRERLCCTIPARPDACIIGEYYAMRIVVGVPICEKRLRTAARILSSVI